MFRAGLSPAVEERIRTHARIAAVAALCLAVLHYVLTPARMAGLARRHVRSVARRAAARVERGQRAHRARRGARAARAEPRSCEPAQLDRDGRRRRAHDRVVRADGPHRDPSAALGARAAAARARRGRGVLVRRAVAAARRRERGAGAHRERHGRAVLAHRAALRAADTRVRRAACGGPDPQLRRAASRRTARSCSARRSRSAC